MRILLTGATGFVGRFVLRELLGTEHTITILLRGKKGKSVTDRFEKEICGDSLYATHEAKLRAVEILEGDLSHLDTLTWSGDLILHCAANVKTLDTYANLYSDNVLGVQQMCDAALAWKIPRVILLSTCYVHPRGTIGKSELLPANLPREVFTTDYTYTKYLGEHQAVSYADRLQLSLLRLSCVGAPAGWLDAHPTPAAMAHLGILSLMFRGRISVVRVPSSSQLSTIPVDLVASEITKHALESPSSSIQVKQLCAGPDSAVWNLSLPRLCETAKRLAPKMNLELVDCEESALKGILEARWGLSKWTPSGYKSLRFHEEVNAFINRFVDGQRFESSIAPDAWPKTTSEAVYEQTCFYVARGIHQFKLEKGIPTPHLDKFWGGMSSNIISGIFQFNPPLHFESKELAEERVFNMIACYRPAFQKMPLGKFQTYDASYKPRVRWLSDSSGDLVIQESIQAPIELEILGTPSEISAIRAFCHHGIGDGIAFLGVVPRMCSLNAPVPQQTLPPPSAKPRPITWTSEFQCFVLYLAFLVKLVFSSKVSYATGSLNTRSETIHFMKNRGETFTCSVLEKLYPGIRQALDKDTITYCVPAMSESASERGFSVPRNAFVPVLLPWGPENNALSQLFLHSKAVRFMSWFLCQVIALTEFNWLRDYLLARVDCVVSSVYATDQPIEGLQSFYFHAPTPTPIPFTASLATIGQQTHITLASRHAATPAVKLMKQVQK